MYVSREEAKLEIRRRRSNPALRRRVEDYVGSIPAFLRHGPQAVLARQVATPNFELLRFALAARSLGLKPHCAEYTSDLFWTGNPDKLSLGKMTIYHGSGRNGGERTACRKVIRLEQSNKRPFCRIETLWGENFVRFHHRLTGEILPEVEFSDCSEWLDEIGGTPAEFWPKHLALYLCHGVLFDNFQSEGQERAFTRDIIRPALGALEERFGLKPLVVALAPLEREMEAFWSWYPGEIEAAIAPMARPFEAPRHGCIPAQGREQGIEGRA